MIYEYPFQGFWYIFVKDYDTFGHVVVMKSKKILKSHNILLGTEYNNNKNRSEYCYGKYTKLW